MTKISWLCILFPWIIGSAIPVHSNAANSFDEVVLHPAIPLLDENGKHILSSSKPYSSRMSCGNGEGSGCHDYSKITHAYHFEQGRDESSDLFGVKRGLPHLT